MYTACYPECLCVCVCVLPKEVECALVDSPSLFDTLRWVLLLPATEHELLVGFVTLRPQMVGSGLQRCR